MKIMKKIKIAQIGVCHEHASGKMNTLRKMSDVYDIVGIVDDRSNNGARFSGDDLKPYEGLNWITEEELFSNPEIQAVFVETSNTDLVPTALRCLKHNLPIHMDKPGGEDLELFSKLRKGYKESNLLFQMGYMFRNNPAMLLCQKAVKKGWLGDIFEIQGNMSHNYGGDKYQEYMGKFKGGIMFNLGCHLIDSITLIMGSPENITPFLQSVSGYDKHIKNNAVTILEYPNATATIRASSCEVNGLNRRRFKICGTKGSIEFSPLERFDGQNFQINLSLLEDNEEYSKGIHIVDFGIIEDRYESQLLEFANIINGKSKQHYTYEHDYLVQKIILAAAGYTKWSN